MRLIALMCALMATEPTAAPHTATNPATVGRSSSSDNVAYRPATVAEFDTLMSRFAKMPGLYARFEEEKHIALLAIPLVNKGTLHYAAPDRLLRRVTSPDTSDVLLLNDALWFDDGVRRQKVDLGTRPEVRAFVASFRALLAGDGTLLKSQYEMKLERTDDDRWKIDLEPKSKALARIVRSIRVRGHGLRVNMLEVVEASGDVGRTRFFDVDPAKSYAAAEADALFGQPG